MNSQLPALRYSAEVPPRAADAVSPAVQGHPQLSVFELPLTARPQSFSVSISGVMYNGQIYWLRPAQCWVLNISDNRGNPLIMGIPLVTGANLLEQFIRYIGPRGALFVLSDQAGVLSDEVVPDWTHLGVTGHVYYRPATVPAIVAA